MYGHECPEVAYEWWDSIGSTHVHVRDNIAEFIQRLGTKACTAVVAAEQTAGIGTYDADNKRRAWIGQKGNLFCTAIFKVPQPLLVDPDTEQPLLHTMPMIMAAMMLVELARLFDSKDEIAQLAWPNDLYWGNHKVGGMFCELPLVPGQGVPYFLPATVRKAQWVHRVEDVPAACFIPVILSFGINLKPVVDTETGETLYHSFPEQEGMTPKKLVDVLLSSMIRRLESGYSDGKPRSMLNDLQKFVVHSGHRLHLVGQLVELLDNNGANVHPAAAMSPTLEYRLEGINLYKGHLEVAIPNAEVHGGHGALCAVMPRTIRSATSRTRAILTDDVPTMEVKAHVVTPSTSSPVSGHAV